ncbi:MAG TPA: glycosyltransferase family 4 protein [Methylomirabilota bacterium]
MRAAERGVAAHPLMRLGLLPALGGSLTELRRTGQDSRLIDGYFRRYVEAFDAVSYFSYAPETLNQFTVDPKIIGRVSLFAPARRGSRAARAWAIPREHAEAIRACEVLRVFQITGVIPALLARRRFGVPYVTTYGFWYGQLAKAGPRRVLKAFVERLGLRHAAAVIVTTEELGARAASVAKRVELIPNGVDTTHFAPGPRASPAGKPRILYVGRLSPEKNLSTVIEAARHLEPGSTTILTGPGPLRETLAAQAARLGVLVEFPGVIEQSKLPAVYRGANAFVLASFTEGHPKVLLEAMACGIPCVASNCAGNRSLITDGKTGLLFDPHSATALAACLKRVLTEPGLADSLASAARAMVVVRYDLGQRVQQEIALLQSVARGRTRDSPV